MRFKIFAIVSFVAGLCACDPSTQRARQDEHLIGEKLKDVSSMTAGAGQGQDHIAVFDKAVRRVHQFDLSKNVFERSFAVLNPALEHFVLYDQAGNYIIDFTTKHLAIYNKSGQMNANVLKFTDKPKSASFKSALGLLVMYGDQGTVGVVKLDSDGNVLKADSFGSAFGTTTISAGDIDESGQLIVALNDGKIAVVDLDASLASGAWTYTTVNSVLNNCVWLSQIRGSPTKVFVQQEDRMSIIDLTTGASLQDLMVDRTRVMFYGKSPDGHIIYDDPNDSGKIIVSYPQAGAFVTRTLNNSLYAILNSRLDLTNDRWTMISAANAVWDYSSRKTNYTNRRVGRWKLSSVLSQINEGLPEGASFEMHAQRVFIMYPGKVMGYALNFNLESNQKLPLMHFNIPYIN